MIRTKDQAYKVASWIDERLPDGGTVIIAGERIVKNGHFLYFPERNTTQWTPCEIADFIIWPNRKVWNQELR